MEMTVAQCNINKEACKKDNILPLMERFEKFETKIEKKIDDVIAKIGSMPMEMLKMNDDRYASKSLEKKVETLETTKNSTMWDVVKILVQLVIAISFAYMALKK